MSDRKPFADVDPGEDGHAFVCVAGQRFAGGSRAWIQSMADGLNAAVEQRETKLRAVLREMADYDAVAGGNSNWWPKFHELAVAARAALDGTGPAYVPKSQLDEANAKVAQYAAVMDVLDDVRREPHATPADMTEVVRMCAERLEAAGLKKAPEPTGALIEHALTLAGVGPAHPNSRDARHYVSGLIKHQSLTAERLAKRVRQYLMLPDY